MSRFEKKFDVEELHRGKWQPLMVDGDEPKQKQVLVTPEQAKAFNVHSMTRKLRWVEASEKESASKDSETPMAKAKRLKAEIKEAKTVEAVDALAEGGTPAVIAAADKRKTELNAE
jgi:hypothetical protein